MQATQPTPGDEPKQSLTARPESDVLLSPGSFAELSERLRVAQEREANALEELRAMRIVVDYADNRLMQGKQIALAYADLKVIASKAIARMQEGEKAHEKEVLLRRAEARATEAEAALQQITSSAFWRAGRPLREFLARHPTLARNLRSLLVKIRETFH